MKGMLEVGLQAFDVAELDYSRKSIGLITKFTGVAGVNFNRSANCGARDRGHSLQGSLQYSGK